MQSAGSIAFVLIWVPGVFLSHYEAQNGPKK